MISLPGWHCSSCRSFNGAEKEWLPICRSCDAPGPPRPPKRTIVESPFAASTAEGIAANIHYARLCVRDSLLRGEAPIASHLLYTQDGVLDDTIHEQRTMGIEAGLAWGCVAELTAVYIDRGTSRGMKYGIERAKTEKRPIEYRNLPGYSDLSTAHLLDASVRATAGRSVLEELEWWSDGCNVCPICERTPETGHTSVCKLAVALGRV